MVNNDNVQVQKIDRKSEIKGTIMLFFAAIAGAAGVVFMKFVLEAGYEPFQVVWMPFGIATLVMLPFSVKKLIKISALDIKAGLAVGSMCGVGYLVGIVGFQYVSASINSFIIGSSVIFVPFLGRMIFKTHVAKISIIAAFMVFAGIGVLAYDGEFSARTFGIILTFISALCVSGQLLGIERYVKKGVNPSLLTFLITGVTFIFGLVASLIFEGPLPPATFSGIGAMLIIGVIGTGGLYFCLTYGEQFVSPTKAAIIYSTQSLFVVVLAAIILSEIIGLQQIVAFVIIFAAIILNETMAPQAQEKLDEKYSRASE